MPAGPEKPSVRARWLHAAMVLGGLIAAQAVLYGPSLIGRKILLPLDLLALPNTYLPATPEYAGIQPYDGVLADQVELFELERRFVAGEYRARRLPLWNPSVYLGAPFVVWDKYSPFSLLYCLFPSPVTLAWLQLLKSLLAGSGAYLFFRRVLGVGFWPAAVGAWCYPLTGFFTLWQGYPHTYVTACLPWVLLATDGVVRRPLGWGGPALAVLTGLILVMRIDVALQVLLVAGLYASWRLWDIYWPGRDLRRACLAGVAAALAWSLGFLCAAPYLLPFAEYTRSGDRLLRRGEGQEEREPGGLFELPRIVLPEVYGATHVHGYMQVAGNLPESAASTYTGLLATLFLAPLAWCSRRHRSFSAFAAVLALVGVSWVLNLPGFVPLLRAPGLNLLSHNRFVFAASFAILTLAVIGLEMIREGEATWRRWFILPGLVLVTFGVWCGIRALGPPQPDYADPDGPLAPAGAWEYWRQVHYAGLLLCAVALGGWLWIHFRGPSGRWFGPVLAAGLLAELFWFAYERNPQCDPALYYPPVPLLERLAEVPPGRVVGINCLPANLAMTAGLRDIRGYDSVDPRPELELLERVRHSQALTLTYARVQWYYPEFRLSPTGELHLPPLMSLLGVRYVIFRGAPPRGIQPLLVSPDYWAVENRQALPRVFVPAQVERAPDRAEDLLALLASPDFEPARVAYVENEVSLAPGSRGTATIVQEVPLEVIVKADMETPGLLVLSDLWYEGWHAYRDGHPVPILRTNHALRGIVLPAGQAQIVFRYEPASFSYGIALLLVGLVGLAAWIVGAGWRNWNAKTLELPC